MIARGISLTKVLAIDVGEKRVGLASSDELGMIAAPYGFMAREGSIQKVADIIVLENVGQIVVGMPYMPSGTLGTQAADVQEFIAELKEQTSVAMDFENEVLSSVEATSRLKSMKRKIKDKGEVDAMAATIILESYLNRR
jgi:putative Holliday junction resolvase